MDFALTGEQQRLRRIARDFAYHELWPTAQRLDKAASARDAYPGDLVRRASELGLRTLKIPREHGGLGIDAVTEMIVLEEIATGDCGFAMTLAHAWREGNLLARWGTADQRARFLPDFLADPGYLTALANTESHAGSDNGLPYAGDLQAGPLTTAVAEDGCWADWPLEKLVRDAATIMLPPIGNEASWVRAARQLSQLAGPTPLVTDPAASPAPLPFTPPAD